MIEFRALAYFVTACRSETLARAADDLGIAVSTLSGALKALEQDLDVVLFRRAASGIHPTPAARLLLRAADPLLIAERFARRLATQPNKVQPRVLSVELELGFTIGGISQAMRRAVETFAAERPDVLVDPVWNDDKDHPGIGPLAAELAAVQRDIVHIRLGRDPAARKNVLLRDEWVLTCRLPAATRKPPAAADLLGGRIIVPALAPALVEQADRYFRQTRVAGVRFLPDHPGDLPRLIDENPEAAVFVPASLVSPRLGLHNVATIPVDRAPPMVVVADAAGNALTTTFIKHLRSALDQPNNGRPERPAMSLRQIHYFGMVQRLRRVSAAARAINISQPALSEQLHKLEGALGGALFARRGDGVVPTDRGERFAPLAALMETRARQLTELDANAAPQSRRIALGILPSVNQHGFLLNRVAEALIDLQQRRPALRLSIQEASNAVLQDWVMRGLIGIAIVETGLPHMPRLPLGSSEPLAAIAHVDQDPLPPGPVTLAELLTHPLVLPTQRSGLRRLLDDAAAEKRLKVSTTIEADTLPMAVTMLARLPICTVLPVSAIRREIDSGELIAHPIIDPQIARRLYVIYSGERALTQPERDLVNALRKKLTGG
ncbi:LysR family transcriptional regulator [Rhodopseudomonas sp. B29]|uniref:LysR family transcriptional regulator n=1 Tax=Rhodopseudomonas sp. B29 TaxID=95607 RepID=UPI00034B20CF|nr:LysR family transcriptional regulator [Rhodopseudomonas sp. B29]